MFQLFFLWFIVTMFKFLKDSNCVPEDSVFRQFISSMMTILTSQAKTAFSLQKFLQQVRQESYVSHLPGSTHPLVKHALLSTPSSSALFSEDVILVSLTQVKDDSQLSLLKNLSSLKGGGKVVSTSSSSGYHHWDASSSSSRGRGFSKSFLSCKRPALSSPSRRSKVAFKGILRSPTPKEGSSK